MNTRISFGTLEVRECGKNTFVVKIVYQKEKNKSIEKIKTLFSIERKLQVESVNLISSVYLNG